MIITMSWNNADELVVANSGQVYVAPAGTPLPSSPVSPLNSAFVGLGLITEDGASFSRAPTIQEYRSWQRRSATRREVTETEIQVTFALQQWNEETVPLAFGGGQVTALTGNAGYRYDPPQAADSLDDRCMVIDAKDGSTHLRWVIENGNVTEAVESQLQRGATSDLPITFKVLAPDDDSEGWYFLTDAPGFVPGS